MTRTHADVDAIADEIEHQDYDLVELKARRGRPATPLGISRSRPSSLDPDLRQAVPARAAMDNRTASEIIRDALRAYLHVA